MSNIVCPHIQSTAQLSLIPSADKQTLSSVVTLQIPDGVNLLGIKQHREEVGLVEVEYGFIMQLNKLQTCPPKTY